MGKRRQKVRWTTLEENGVLGSEDDSGHDSSGSNRNSGNLAPTATAPRPPSKRFNAEHKTSHFNNGSNGNYAHYGRGGRWSVAPRFERRGRFEREGEQLQHLPDGFTKIRSKNLDVLFKKDYYAHKSVISDAKENENEEEEDEEADEAASTTYALDAEAQPFTMSAMGGVPPFYINYFVPTSTSAPANMSRPNLFLYSPSSNTMIPCEEIIIPNPSLNGDSSGGVAPSNPNTASSAGSVFASGSPNIFFTFPGAKGNENNFNSGIVSNVNSMLSSEISSEPGSADSTTPHTPPDLAAAYSPMAYFEPVAVDFVEWQQPGFVHAMPNLALVPVDNNEDAGKNLDNGDTVCHSDNVDPSKNDIDAHGKNNISGAVADVNNVAKEEPELESRASNVRRSLKKKKKKSREELGHRNSFSSSSDEINSAPPVPQAPLAEDNKDDKNVDDNVKTVSSNTRSRREVPEFEVPEVPPSIVVDLESHESKRLVQSRRLKSNKAPPKTRNKSNRRVKKSNNSDIIDKTESNNIDNNTFNENVIKDKTLKQERASADNNVSKDMSKKDNVATKEAAVTENSAKESNKETKNKVDAAKTVKKDEDNNKKSSLKKNAKNKESPAQDVNNNTNKAKAAIKDTEVEERKEEESWQKQRRGRGRKKFGKNYGEDRLELDDEPEVVEPKENLIDAKTAVKSEPKSEPKLEPKSEPKFEPKSEPKLQPKSEPKLDPKSKEEPKIESNECLTRSSSSSDRPESASSRKRSSKKRSSTPPTTSVSTTMRPVLVHDGLLALDALRVRKEEALLVRSVGHNMLSGPIMMGRFGMSKYSPPDRSAEIPDKFKKALEEEKEEEEEDGQEEEENTVQTSDEIVDKADVADLELD